MPRRKRNGPRQAATGQAAAVATDTVTAERRPAARRGAEARQDPAGTGRDPVTKAEALEAAQSAVPSLRTCTDVPRHVTADLASFAAAVSSRRSTASVWSLTIRSRGTGCAVQSLKRVAGIAHFDTRSMTMVRCHRCGDRPVGAWVFQSR